MGKKSSSMPSVPDEFYEALTNQANATTEYYDWYENEMYPWYKEVTEQSNATYQQLVDSTIEDAEWWRNWTAEETAKSDAIRDSYYNNWKENYLPIEQQLIEDAKNYNSDAYAEQQAQAAIGDVAAAFANQRQQTAINMSKYGVDPTSGQYMGQMNALGVNQAAATAAAANSARQAAVELGWSKNLSLAQMGLQYAGLTNDATNANNNTAATGSSATTSSVGSTLSANSGSSQNLYNLAQTGLNSFQALANSWGSMANSYNSLYGNQVSAWSAQQQANSSIWSGLGTMTGLLGGAAIRTWGA